MAAAPMLQAWLRTLWQVAPALHPIDDGTTPFITERGLHLPLGLADASALLAASAHAGAHLVYSRPGAAVQGLRPTTRLLAGLLEDARIEWLAARELPGLGRLWRAMQPAEPATGTDAASLMRRLARALADADQVDTHPWVAKGRRLMFLDDAQQVLALRQFDAVRHAASLLGNDLGQMRLPVDVRGHRPWPAYRDDNRWLWQAEPPTEVQPAGANAGAAGAPSAPVPAAADGEQHVYPEWDRRIARLRPGWTTVRETTAPSAPVAPEPAAWAALQRRLSASLQSPDGAARQRLRRQADGDTLDLEALVPAWVARRARGDAEPALRVHRRHIRRARPGHVLLMLDTSASSAEPAGATGHAVLDLVRLAARVGSRALEQAGHRCAVQAFGSEGRSAVRVLRVKGFDEPGDGPAMARLAGLRSQWSTRLGAAIRHGARALGQAPAPRPRHLVIITDGEPHDVDVAEPHYLAEDARHAVREARRQGVHVFCLGLQPSGAAVLRRVFGGGHYRGIDRLAALPGALARACR